MGGHRSVVSLLVDLATGDQHGNRHRDVPHGVSDPPHAEQDSLAVQLKLNEMVATLEGAPNRLVNVEDLSEE